MKNDFKNGFIANIPIGISVFVYGAVLGVLASQKGVELYELMLMNIFIFAGSAQFIMIDMWSSSIDIIAIVISALMINIRYFLIGASLNPLFIQSSKKDKFKYMHLVADENWAITMNRFKDEQITPLFLFGGGVCLLFTWSLGTMFGFSLGEFISNPYIYGLDFAFVAIFIALTVNMYGGKNDLLPWLITALSAILAEYFLPGKLYIIIGALVGSFTSVICHSKEYT